MFTEYASYSAYSLSKVS